MEKTKDVLGRIVTSKAGRDKGRKFIVVDILDENHLMVSDGILRRMDKPKKKKLIHLNISNEFDEKIRQKLADGISVTNSEIRKVIFDLNSID